MDISKLINIAGISADMVLIQEFNNKYSPGSYSNRSQFGLSESDYCAMWKKIIFLLQQPRSSDEMLILLSALRILSRDKQSLSLVVDEAGLQVIIQLTGLEVACFNSSLNQIGKSQLQNDHQVCIQACHVLSNVVYQNSIAQRIFCSSCSLSPLLLALRSHATLPHELTVACVRLLFLVTAFTPSTSQEAVVQHDALTALLPLLNTQSDVSTLPATMQSEAVELAVECLKVLCNVCASTSVPQNDGGITTRMVAGAGLRPQDDQAVVRVVARVRDLLVATAHTHQQTELMHSHCINLLVCVPTSALAALTPSTEGGGNRRWGDKGERRCTVYRDTDVSAIVQVLTFLHARLNVSAAQTSDQLTPVLTLLVSACQQYAVLRRFVRLRVMPPLRDASQRPEEGVGLRGRLVALMTSPVLELKHLSATLLFVLCKQSVDRLIKYSGYGNSAGLLASLGLLAGSGRQGGETSSDSEDSETDEYERIKHMVNPVTGCYEPVRPNPLEEMSEEQREYETMRLVNALDKLIRDGPIRPCSVGEDGRPRPVEHVLQLQEGVDPTGGRRADDEGDED